MSRIAIVGSRPRGNPYTPLDVAVRDAVVTFIDSLPSDAIIVSGGAAGVDTWAHEHALFTRLKTIVHHPSKYLVEGRSASRAEYAAACHRRNADIVNDCDEIVAFWDGLSSGTLSTIEKASRVGRRVDIRHWSQFVGRQFVCRVAWSAPEFRDQESNILADLCRRGGEVG